MVQRLVVLVLVLDRAVGLEEGKVVVCSFFLSFLRYCRPFVSFCEDGRVEKFNCCLS